MNKKEPKIIKKEEIANILYDKFKDRDYINCYIGSNAAAPTALIEALSKSIKQSNKKRPFFKMIHLLLPGRVPFVDQGMQDKVKSYSIFSAGEVREAANDGRAYYLPCTLGNMDNVIGKGRRYEPDVVILKVRRNDYTGEYSMGLSVEALHTAIDHAKVIIAELDQDMAFTHGQSVLDETSIDYIVTQGVKPVYDFPAPDFDKSSGAEKRIGELIAQHFIQDEATLQIGIGKIPDAVIGTIKNAGFKNLGVQTEIYGDGLMELQKLGIINNRKKKLDMGYSATSMVMGSKELYDFVNMRLAVQMRPCQYTNSADTIRRNTPFISINTAMGVDFYGNIWTAYIDLKKYYGGVGGQPDFIRALDDQDYGVPIIAIKSVTNKGESKIAPAHPAGVSLTASSYDPIVVVTEYGIADLRGLTQGLKALATASIAHPKYRDGFLKSIFDNPMFTKPFGYIPGKTPPGVIMYSGDTKI
ncbi:MAG: hypothetical protein JRJ44_09480 [Deltaproteobacteria bacterium]|nr:hypothetical protein [Deltaproteobacteria bacterium]